jgi:hypothetical protein
MIGEAKGMNRKEQKSKEEKEMEREDGEQNSP